MKENWYSSGIMRSCWRIQTGNIMSYGVHRRSIMEKMTKEILLSLRIFVQFIIIFRREKIYEEGDYDAWNQYI